MPNSKQRLTGKCSAFDDFLYLVQKYVPWESGSAKWEHIGSQRAMGIVSSDSE